ncbi:Putative peptidase S54, rhomboid domain, Rhomboid-like superfamily [Septoria linicola]|uniref:Peptidase S54, rhomboid domain, Rhomboid-like superfamily n=1 Tax=Septoria linicola TaxID=215465 RepID=A0A9Q9EFE9_9PEZI|nr:putative peptidase S54, rhomboid domain, Rhomboid-like superfamily [Septoria linicola]USW49696.1 Putative peptidase S54, rhomboid domain, Rhomboid-like superfamily [Septoria linicola]
MAGLIAFARLDSWGLPEVGMIHTVVLWLGSAASSTVAGHIFAVYNVTVDMQPRYKTGTGNLGASGLRSGVHAALVILSIRRRQALRSKDIITMWLGLLYPAYKDVTQLFSNDGIGHDAHLGGMLFGIAYGLVILYFAGEGKTEAADTMISAQWQAVCDEVDRPNSDEIISEGEQI